MSIQTAELNIEPPKDVDTEMAVNKLKNRKTTGHDPVSAELINEGGKELKKFIYEII
jgi:hypothetical protein